MTITLTDWKEIPDTVEIEGTSMAKIRAFAEKIKEFVVLEE